MFAERPTEVFKASGYEEKGGVIEFFDADIAEDESSGTRVFTRSSVLEIIQLDD